MASNEVTAGRAYVLIGAKLDASFNKTLGSIKGLMGNMGMGLIKAGAAIGGLGASITGPMFAMTYSAMKFQAEMGHVGERVGLTAETFSELVYAGSLVDLTMADISGAMVKMSASMFDVAKGSKQSAAMLKILGLNARDLLGMKPEDQFLAIADAISKIEDQTLKVAAARKFFGRGGVQLLPLLSQGRAGIQAQRADARRLGVSVSKADADASENAERMQTRLTAAVQGFYNVVSRAVIPTLIKKTLWMTNLVSRVREYLAANPALVQTVFDLGKALVVAGAALIGLGTAFKAMSVLVTPGGVLFLLGAILLYITGALDGVLAKWKDVVLSFEIGGRSIAQWIGLIAKLWTDGFIPVISSVGRAIAAVFSAAFASIKSDFYKLMGDLIVGLSNLLTTFADKISLAAMALEKGGLLDRMQAKALYGMRDIMDKISNETLAQGTKLQVKGAIEDTTAQAKTTAAVTELKGVADTAAKLGKVAADTFSKPIAKAMETIFGAEGGPVKGLQDILKGLGQEFAAVEGGAEQRAGAAAAFMDETKKRAFATTGTFSAVAAEAMTREGSVMGIQQKQLDEVRQIKKLLKEGLAEGASIVYQE